MEATKGHVFQVEEIVRTGSLKYRPFLGPCDPSASRNKDWIRRKPQESYVC